MCDYQTHEQVLDIRTPKNLHLSAFYKRSFAFRTVKNRMPVIITQVIDGLARSVEEVESEYGPEASEELKTVIGEISKLKYEVQTNKPLRELTSNGPDVKFYNDYIREQARDNGHTSFFSSIWLLSECYMYRRIREAFELTEKLQNYDPFRKQKQESYLQAQRLFAQLSQHLYEVLAKSEEANICEFVILLKLNLWGNKCDLSLSEGVVDSRHDKLFEINSLQPFILCDHSQEIWDTISSQEGSDIVDIVLDNAGYEVFTDLCLADYIISKKLAQKVRFYVKTIPWFISDVMLSDFNWLIEQLQISENETLKQLGEKWNEYVKNEIWTVVESGFWTLPVDFNCMRKIDVELYKQLGEAKLVIFKGDLNYRKLFGDKNWLPSTSVDEGLRNFHPTKLCILRTIKADIVCGITQEIADKLEELNPRWMESGEYGLIQFSGKFIPIFHVY